MTGGMRGEEGGRCGMRNDTEMFFCLFLGHFGTVFLEHVASLPTGQTCQTIWSCLLFVLDVLADY